MSVKIITKQDCGYCVEAKRVLRDCDIPYEEVDVTNDFDFCQEMKQNSWTVPIIWFDDKLIGGYTDLCDYVIQEDLY